MNATAITRQLIQ